ncbi:MAG: hypothetical protein U0992_15510 [Planctomycetaceae bacterium]
MAAAGADSADLLADSGVIAMAAVDAAATILTAAGIAAKVTGIDQRVIPPQTTAMVLRGMRRETVRQTPQRQTGRSRPMGRLPKAPKRGSA